MKELELVARITLKVCDDILAFDKLYFVVGVSPHFALVCEHEHGESVGVIKRITMADALAGRSAYVIKYEGFDSAEVVDKSGER